MNPYSWMNPAGIKDLKALCRVGLRLSVLILGTVFYRGRSQCAVRHMSAVLCHNEASLGQVGLVLFDTGYNSVPPATRSTLYPLCSEKLPPMLCLVNISGTPLATLLITWSENEVL